MIISKWPLVIGSKLPGYIALSLHNPYKVGITFIISIITFGIVYILSKIILIYGGRRLILCLLIGFFLGYIFREINKVFISGIEIEYIGYIIPGLIASWMDRQGVIRTISVIFIVSSIVNLIMMYIYYLDQFRNFYV